MSCTLVFEEGNSPVLQVIVRNALTGAYINDATVNATIRDATGAEVAGQSWPMSLTYVPSSSGVYRAMLSSGIALVAGQSYRATFTIADPTSGATRTLNYDVLVTEPGCGNAPPPTEPSSPAYQGPTPQTLLHEARAAYHRLMLGLSPRVVVDQNGERVEYTAANAPRLQQYIAGLEMQLGLTTAAQRGPAGVCF